jgi:hypothetical protein
MKEIISNFESIKEEEMTKYAGEWIAVVESKVVAHGKSFKEVYSFVKSNYPNKRPLIGKLPDSIPTILNVN